MKPLDEYIIDANRDLLDKVEEHYEERFRERCEKMAEHYEEKMAEQYKELTRDPVIVAQSVVTEIMGKLMLELPEEVVPVVRAAMNRLASPSPKH